MGDRVEHGSDQELGKSCVCLHLRRATRHITQIYDDALRPHGMRATQFSVLVAIHHLGPVAMQDLAARLDVERTSLTRNLDVLEDRGWVEITPGSDRRLRLVSLTTEGRAALREAIPSWEAVQLRIVQQIGTLGLEDLLSGLERVRSTRGAKQLR